MTSSTNAKDATNDETEESDGAIKGSHDPQPQSVDDLARNPMPARAAGMAMTWTKLSHDATLGVDHIGCDNCNAYSGGTPCTSILPLLCIKQDGSPKPNGLVTDFYNGWAGGHIATTHAVRGATLTSLEVADQLCVDNFGPGWKMAEFHDGQGGWNWYAFGNVRQDTRLWVYINDQPSNCWNP